MISPTVKTSIEALEIALSELKKTEQKLSILDAYTIDIVTKKIYSIVKDVSKPENGIYNVIV